MTGFPESDFLSAITATRSAIFFYCESDIYNFDKHDMELNPAFCKAVLDLTE